MDEPSKSSNNTATLGCGSLIIIILVVMLFGNSGSKRVQEDVQRLNQRIDHLAQKIDDQTDQIRELSEAPVAPSAPSPPAESE